MPEGFILILPDAVKLNRFLADDFVFILGIVTSLVRVDACACDSTGRLPRALLITLPDRWYSETAAVIAPQQQTGKGYPPDFIAFRAAHP